jgi:hypothetical protein
MLSGAADAPNIIDGAVFKRVIGGKVCYFEADNVAAKSASSLIHVGEIKSFPKVDERVESDKAAGALDQAALYVVLGREFAESVLQDPGNFDDHVMLITPKNTRMTATLSVVPVGPRIKRMNRIVAAIPSASEVAAAVPTGVTFGHVADHRSKAERDVQPIDLAADRRIQELHAIADAVGYTFHPECFSTCGLAAFCRSREQAAGSLDLMGKNLVRILPGIHSLQRAGELADGAPPGPNETHAAARLARAHQLYDQFRASHIVQSQAK